MDDASLINPDDWVDQYGDALNTEEICKVMDITASNCWVMLYRARMLLRRCHRDQLDPEIRVYVNETLDVLL